MRENERKLTLAERIRRIDPYRLRHRMVQDLGKRGITDQRVLAVMDRLPRHLFVDEALAGHAYDDCTLPIGFGQTISHPYTVARMTELIRLEKGMRVLEIGTGSGYQTAVLAAMGCSVYTVERLPGLYESAARVLDFLHPGTIRMYLRDGTLGVPEAAPYDRIIVTAGDPEVPAPLVEQLDEKGIMLIPVGERPGSQRLQCVVRKGSSAYSRDCGPAVFVDLVGNHGWRP